MDKFVLATLRGLTNIDVLKLELKKKRWKKNTEANTAWSSVLPRRAEKVVFPQEIIKLITNIYSLSHRKSNGLNNSWCRLVPLVVPRGRPESIKASFSLCPERAFLVAAYSVP